MKLLSLSAHVCQAFSSPATEAQRTVQKVKNDQPRDVVTTLDRRLHEITAAFMASQMPECRLLSEEDQPPVCVVDALDIGEWLVVDPLDGSNNYALMMPGYGYMAAHVVSGKVVGSLVVLPEHDLYLILEGGKILISQPFPQPPAAAPSSSVYYAYPPSLNSYATKSRCQLIDLIDNNSSGLYRYGSSCVGLYNLIRGRHSSFIGHGIRIWDALAYFPLLERFGISARYHLGRSGLFLVASFDQAFVEQASDIISMNENIKFSVLATHSELVITS